MIENCTFCGAKATHTTNLAIDFACGERWSAANGWEKKCENLRVDRMKIATEMLLKLRERYPPPK
jgi:hypothetical protein